MKPGIYSPLALAFESELDDTALQNLYSWIDGIPLSRPKKNIARDFSDGVLAAEVVRHFVPRVVEIHNYTPASSTGQKVANWQTLNRKVFSKIGLRLPDSLIKQVASAQTGSVEVALNNIKLRIEATFDPNQNSNASNKSYLSPLYDPQVQFQDKSTYMNNLMAPPVIDNSTNPLLNIELEKRMYMAERDQNFYEQQETIHLLQMKVRRLEHLVHLRDMRIENLTSQVSEAEGRLQVYETISSEIAHTHS